MDLVINDTLTQIPPQGNTIQSASTYPLNILNCINQDNQHLPLADFLSRYHGLEKYDLVMSPIHWQATHNDALVVASGTDLYLGEAKTLFNLVQDYLAAENLTLHFCDNYHWLIKGHNLPQLNSPALPAILHQSLMPVLSQLDPSLYWQRIFTELQMLLASRTNLGQTDSDQCPVNGFWLYGSGQLTIDSKKIIFSDDEKLRGLFPDKIKPWQVNSPRTSNTVWILTNANILQTASIKKDLEKQKTRWFWNNIAYTMPAKNWWNKLWRKITHADQATGN